MKIFILTLLTALSISLVSCESSNDENIKMAREISECISESLKSLDDSTFNNIVITSVSDDSSQDNISVSTSGISSDDKGNLYISISASNDNDSDIPDEWWISIVAIIATFLMFSAPIFLVFIVCHFIYKSKRDRNRVIMESIASGHTLPDRFYNIPDRKPRLQPAVNYLAWSAGFFAFFVINHKIGIAMLTLIPFIIGLGKLATYIIATRNDKNCDNNNKNNDTTTFCDSCDNAE